MGDTEIKLVAVDEDGEVDHAGPAVPRGQEGELLIRGPQVTARNGISQHVTVYDGVSRLRACERV